jgi:hypothetical protein
MSLITLFKRLVKGSPLSTVEVDGNWTKIEALFPSASDSDIGKTVVLKSDKTGFDFVELPSGSTPSLSQVTTVDNVTEDGINFLGLSSSQPSGLTGAQNETTLSLIYLPKDNGNDGHTLVKSVNGKYADIYGNVISNILPNGVKFITESRDLESDDAGYLLFAIDESIFLTMPMSSPFSDGELIGFATSSTTSSIELKTGDAIFPLSDNGDIAQSEILLLKYYDTPINALVPLTGSIIKDSVKYTPSRYFYDNSGVINRTLIQGSVLNLDEDFTALPGKAYILGEATAERTILFDTPQDGDIYRFNNPTQGAFDYVFDDNLVYDASGAAVGLIPPETIIIIQYDLAQGRFNLISSQQ